MSGILNEYTATSVKYSQAENLVYLRSETGNQRFQYTFLCRRNISGSNISMYFFFNVENKQCLVVCPTLIGYMENSYKCQLLRFYIEGDLPVLSVRLFDNQDKVIADIADEFSEKYGSYVLDGIINQ